MQQTASDRPKMQPIQRFSSPRSKKNIYKTKSVKNLIYFHAAASASGGGGGGIPSEGVISGRNLVQKTKLQSSHFCSDSDFSKSPGRQLRESPSNKL